MECTWDVLSIGQQTLFHYQVLRDAKALYIYVCISWAILDMSRKSLVGFHEVSMGVLCVFHVVSIRFTLILLFHVLLHGSSIMAFGRARWGSNARGKVRSPTFSNRFHQRKDSASSESF